MAVLWGMLWWVGASALLYFSWNKVVATLTTAKQAKFWQALLIVATLAAFCAPRYCMKKGRYGGSQNPPADLSDTSQKSTN